MKAIERSLPRSLRGFNGGLVVGAVTLAAAYVFTTTISDAAHMGRTRVQNWLMGGDPS